MPQRGNVVFVYPSLDYLTPHGDLHFHPFSCCCWFLLYRCLHHTSVPTAPLGEHLDWLHVRVTVNNAVISMGVWISVVHWLGGRPVYFQEGNSWVIWSFLVFWGSSKWISRAAEPLCIPSTVQTVCLSLHPSPCQLSFVILLLLSLPLLPPPLLPLLFSFSVVYSFSGCFYLVKRSVWRVVIFCLF